MYLFINLSIQSHWLEGRVVQSWLKITQGTNLNSDLNLKRIKTNSEKMLFNRDIRIIIEPRDSANEPSNNWVLTSVYFIYINSIIYISFFN